MNKVLARRLEQVRSRKWVVLGVTVLCVAVAALTSLVSQPTYTGKSTLMIACPAGPPIRMPLSRSPMPRCSTTRRHKNA